MELAATIKALLDAGKVADKAMRGGRLLERMSSDSMDVYTLLSARHMAKDVWIGDEAKHLDNVRLTDQPEGAENFDLDDTMEDNALSKQEMERKIQDEAEEYISEKREQYLREERNPSKMPANTAKRLADKGEKYNSQNWAQLDSPSRMGLLQEMYKDMAEEACLPADLIKNTKIEMGSLESANATTNLFVWPDEISGEFRVAAEPVISFEKELICKKDYSFEEAAETLYHETVHVMQQQCLAEPGNTFSYYEQEEEWSQDVAERISGEAPKSYVEYLKEPMETYAHQQASIFTKMYGAMRAESM